MMRTRWWLWFSLSATLPIWAIATVWNLGGWVTDEINFSTFQWFVRCCFLAAFGLTMFCLRATERSKLTKIFAGTILGVVLLYGVTLTFFSSICSPTTMQLGRAFSQQAKRIVAKGDCNAVALGKQIVADTL